MGTRQVVRKLFPIPKNSHLNVVLNKASELFIVSLKWVNNFVLGKHLFSLRQGGGGVLFYFLGLLENKIKKHFIFLSPSQKPILPIFGAVKGRYCICKFVIFKNLNFAARAPQGRPHSPIFWNWTHHTSKPDWQYVQCPVFENR